MGTVIFMVICGLGYLVIMLIESAAKESSENWFKQKYRQNRLNLSNIKIELKNDFNQAILLTNDNRLYYANKDKDIFVEINKSRILKVDCSYKTKSKTIKKPIALVGTYKTVTDLTGIKVSIITDLETYSIFLGNFGININAERAERLAVIVNDMIENSKNQNREVNVVENKTILIDSNNSNEGYCINCGAKVIAKFCGECGTQNYKYNTAGDEA